MLLRRLILTVYFIPVFGGKGKIGGLRGSSQRVYYPRGYGLSGTSHSYRQGTNNQRVYPPSNKAGYPPSGGLSGNTRKEIHPISPLQRGLTYHPFGRALSGTSRGYGQETSYNRGYTTTTRAPSRRTTLQRIHPLSNRTGYPSSGGLSGNTREEIHHDHHYSPPQNINNGSNYHPSGRDLSGTSRGYPYRQETSYNRGYTTTTAPSRGTTYQRGYPSSNRTGYPPSGPSGGLSGTGNTRNNIHHNFHYLPPQHISYGSTYHPVYHGTPPVYVYKYRNSGSRFDNLLTGLALYNLGRISAHQDRYRRYGSEYRPNPGEMCKLAISHRNGEYEETRVDCRLMSSFIWDAERESKTVSTHTVVSQTVKNNGTTVQNTTVVDALQVTGPSLQVTPGMDCFMIRISRDTSQLRRRVDCALLQEYAIRSYNNCDNLKSKLPLVVLCCVVFLLSNK